MKNNFLTEIAFSLVLLIVLILLSNPFNLLMPQPIQMMTIVVFALIFILFAGFMWREKVADEREGLHRYVAGRFAYLAGVAVLVVGVITQSLKHILDPWLIWTLGAMIFAKIVGLIYSKFKH